MEILEERGLSFEEIIVLNGADAIRLPDQLPEIARLT
jgi:hypothetical protein